MCTSQWTCGAMYSESRHLAYTTTLDIRPPQKEDHLLIDQRSQTVHAVSSVRICIRVKITPTEIELATCGPTCNSGFVLNELLPVRIVDSSFSPCPLYCRSWFYAALTDVSRIVDPGLPLLLLNFTCPYCRSWGLTSCCAVTVAPCYSRSTPTLASRFARKWRHQPGWYVLVTRQRRFKRKVPWCGKLSD